MRTTSVDRWDVRIARARMLAGEHPAASEVLTFYAELAAFQKSTSAFHLKVEDPAASFEDIVSAVPAFLSFLCRAAPTRLAEVAASMRAVELAEWRSLLERYWSADDHEVPDADEATIFVVEALLQPIVEASFARDAPLTASAPTPLFELRRGLAVALRAKADKATASLAEARDASDRERRRKRRATGVAATPSSTIDDHNGGGGSPRRAGRCPACSGKPVVGVLREEGQSARRSLVCGLCLTEWLWPRIVCPACGEDAFESLSVYRSEAFAAARVDACDSCRMYLKTIDLSKDAHAVPVVDELAGVPLDLWAREQGYTKLRSNLLRM